MRSSSDSGTVAAGAGAAFRDGIGRVAAAPALLAGVFVVTFTVALPLGLTMRGLLRAHLGSSLAAEAATAGVNYDWWQEFAAQAGGLGRSFTISIIGFAAVLDNISSVLDATAEIAPVLAALTAYLTVWTFLAGGIMDRYARSRPLRAHGFFAACGVFFLRFLRLAAFAGIAYYLLFAHVHGWLFDDLYGGVTRQLSVERTAFAWRTALYLVFAGLLVAVNTIFDYAKIRAVVEDRRSMIAALAAGVRFVLRHPRSVLALYALNSVLFAAAIAAWAVVSPGAGARTWTAFAAGQTYVLVRLAVKLQFLASQTALFQRSLAHAAYTAAPEARWPESPAAERIPTASLT